MSKILYVEDEIEHRAMMQLILSNEHFKGKSDFTLIEAGGGREAIQQVKVEFPDLVLLDLAMPDLNGYDVIKQLKADPETRDIPIIVLSSWPTPDNKERAIKAGAIDFIEKPYDPFELIKVLKNHLLSKNGLKK